MFYLIKNFKKLVNYFYEFTKAMVYNYIKIIDNKKN